MMRTLWSHLGLNLKLETCRFCQIMHSMKVSGIKIVARGMEEVIRSGVTEASTRVTGRMIKQMVKED